MKTLICEMCNSNDLVKENGVFVCQHCGTKYSVEEAKKMMVEGTVDVSGSTVKVDNTDKLSNLYTLARRAVQDGNYPAAHSYYKSILLEDPNSWEAVLYTPYTNGAKIVDDCLVLANQMTDGIVRALELIDKYVPEEKQLDAVKQVSFCGDRYALWVADNVQDYLQRLFRNNVSYSPTLWAEYFFAAAGIRYTVGNFVIFYFNIIDEDFSRIATASIHSGSELLKKYVCDSFLMIGMSKKAAAKINQYTEKIRVYDKSYQGPEIKEGCYIATAVYGSYDCPQVWTLRRFRDNTLRMTWYGRTFVRIYYAISPTLVKWFGNAAWFGKLARGPLDALVTKLNAEGVENTRYED